MAGDRAVVVGHEQAPAVLDLAPDACAQICQQELARLGEAGGDPAFHPDAADLVIFVGARGTDDGIRHWCSRFDLPALRGGSLE
ncbi:hypothetical protein ABIF97_002455 [Bradyrhizobium japonicum]